MKKITFALLFILLLLAACTPPQSSTSVQPTPISQTLPTRQLQAAQTSSPTATAASEMTAWVAPAMPAAGEKLSFEGLDMSDPNVGWGIDILGRIFHTTDGGDTWTFASPPDGAYTSGGFFALDGNIAWAAKDVPVRCWDYWAIYQCDQSYYAAVKSGMVWKTTDGGQTWQPSQPFSLNAENAPYSFDGALPFSPIGLQFIDPQTGWLLVAVGQTSAGEQSLLYRTSDGGVTWKMIQTFGFEPNVYSCRERGFTFTDEYSGWLVSACVDKDFLHHPKFLRTADGGENWSADAQIPEVPIPSELQNEIDDADSGYVDFESPLGGEHFQRYPDGSLGVHLKENPNSYDDIVTFFRLGNQVVDHWVSGVKIWFYKMSVFQRDGWMTMDSEYFLDKNHGWRLYWDVSTNGRWLQKTADGGQTWESTKAVAWRTARFEFIDAQIGWAIVTGQSGQTALVKTTDGGGTWSLLAAHVEGGETLTDSTPSIVPAQNAQLVNIAAFWMIDSSAGWAMTDDDQLLRSADGAQTWQNVTPPAEYKAYQDQCFYGVGGVLNPEGFFALDADQAWVAPHGCEPASMVVWKTTDGGRSWREIPLGEIPPTQYASPIPFFRPVSLSFDDAAQGWLAAGLYPDAHSIESYLFRTQDGGDSWQPVSNEHLRCFPLCTGVISRAPGTIWLADDSRSGISGERNYLDLYYSNDGGNTWEQKMLFDTAPPLPINSTSIARIGNLDGGTISRCGTTRLQKFLNGSIGAFSGCDNLFSSPYFSIDYLTLIDENASFKIITDGLIAQDKTGHSGGWTTNQTDFFYNDQLGWRLYIGTNADDNGPIYLQHTQDGGETWETIAPVPWQDARFQFLDSQNGWALVTLPWGNALVKTTDGGKTWEEIKPFVVNP